MILQTIIDERANPSIERDSLSFPSVALIDLYGLYQSQDETPKCFRDKLHLKPEVIKLFNDMEQVLGLFFNSSGFQTIAGEHQVVCVDVLDRALKQAPQTAITVDVFRPNFLETIGQLMSFRLEGASSVVPFLKIDWEFYSNPEWSPNMSGNVFLREHHIGERMKPTFYHQAGLSENIGRLDCEGWRGGPSPLFGILRVEPSGQFRRSKEAVRFIDHYCKAALQDSRTLGE